MRMPVLTTYYKVLLVSLLSGLHILGAFITKKKNCEDYSNTECNFFLYY